MLDENVEYRLALYLRQQGHDVTAVARDYEAGLPDHQVLALALAEQRILLTDDRDFGALVFQQHQPHTGVIYFRLPAATAAEKIALMDRLLSLYADHLSEFLVVSRRRIRVHR